MPLAGFPLISVVIVPYIEAGGSLSPLMTALRFLLSGGDVPKETELNTVSCHPPWNVAGCTHYMYLWGWRENFVGAVATSAHLFRGFLK